MAAQSRDPEKAKRAARDPSRPGSECKAAPGTFRPIVDPSRCEGKQDCVAVCPYDVFELGRITDSDFRALGVMGKLKSIAYGRKTARTPRASSCQACGLCVVACPEHAIRLEKV